MVHDEPRTVYSHDVPVKGRPGVEHSQAVAETCQYLQVVVFGRNPRHPAEEGEDFKDVVGEPEVHKHCGKGPQKELVSSHRVQSLERSRDRNVAFVVERRVEGDGDERRRPHTVRRVHDEPTGEAYSTVSIKFPS